MSNEVAVCREKKQVSDSNQALTIAEELFEHPYEFGFFQAVRLLERIFVERGPVGEHGLPSNEVVKFRTHQSFAFPASELLKISLADEESRPEMTVRFMGLTGPQAVLPHPYTEQILERIRQKDTALWEYFDLFNHRLISLFYKAWEKHRFAIAYERGREDRFTEYLFSLIGMGTAGLRERICIPDQALIYYGGLIAQRPHSSTAITAIVADYFDVIVTIQQYSGQWITLDDECKSRLGSANNQLGINMVAGARVWDYQSKVRLKIGPLTFAQFQKFLPVGSAYRPLMELVRYLLGMEMDFDVQLSLKAEEVPSCTLTAAQRPQLGWTGWLKTRPFAVDDDQVIVTELINNER